MQSWSHPWQSWSGCSISTTTELRRRWPTAEVNTREVTRRLSASESTLGALQLKEGKLRHGTWAEGGPEARVPTPPVCEPSPVTPSLPAPSCSNTWYVLNTLSGSQHVFSLQFFISNIHLGFGLLSNAMWMGSRCLFWTQQSKRRVTEPILPQSKLVLITTPTVGDRLCGTGPMLIQQ